MKGDCGEKDNLYNGKASGALVPHASTTQVKDPQAVLFLISLAQMTGWC